ncbi:hypothetical protein [Streptomyces griseofuscus]|uniref:dioxygenase family protein n=1 Tax=Streptomyces griseofuscus TaxID=146922 RepID=UPI0034149609
MNNGESIVRSPTEGPPLFFTGRIVDTDGTPVAGAEVDVWHASPAGLYENQDPEQAEWNLRGKFFSDEEDVFAFRSIKPSGYPIPIDGPVGELLTALERHPFRLAHLHALIHKPGYKTIASQLYSHDDPILETDAQFGVVQSLVGTYVRHEYEPAPGPDVSPGTASSSLSSSSRVRHGCRPRPCRASAAPRRTTCDPTAPSPGRERCSAARRATALRTPRGTRGIATTAPRIPAAAASSSRSETHTRCQRTPRSVLPVYPRKVAMLPPSYTAGALGLVEGSRIPTHGCPTSRGERLARLDRKLRLGQPARKRGNPPRTELLPQARMATCPVCAVRLGPA